ncbi:hypothetical protein [Paenibacillus agricola]|nr:hypothetical protein [Paenibacillus agricola]
MEEACTHGNGNKQEIDVKPGGVWRAKSTFDRLEQQLAKME